MEQITSSNNFFLEENIVNQEKQNVVVLYVQKLFNFFWLLIKQFNFC